MKKFKTIEEQKEYLISSKNLYDDELITKVFYERPYVSIINPYKKFFYTSIDGNNHKYDDKISINDYYKLATLDDMFAKELHYFIGIFERRIKSAFAYVISEKMKIIGDDSATLYIEIFNDIDNKLVEFVLLGFNDYKYTYNKALKTIEITSLSTQQYRKEFLKDLADINQDKKRKNKLFEKYINTATPIPFWLVVHTLSLGDLASLYQMLGKELKNKILVFLNSSIEIPVFSDSIFKFEDDLMIIKDLRNVINHYEPLYEFIRNTPKRKILNAISRIEKYSKKIIDESFEHLLGNLPTFKNNQNDNIVSIYCDILKVIKKEMT